MRHAVLVCVWLGLSSCSLTEPTYMDVPPSIARTIDLESGNMDEIKMQLTRQLGHPVVDVFREEGAMVAEIRPVLEEAAEDVQGAILKNPLKPQEWLAGGIAAGLTIIFALMGFRGRSRRRKEEGTA